MGEQFARLEDAVGAKQAASIRSLCWALLWGKTTGNSINNARNKIFRLEIPSLLDVFLLVYYGPLFLVIGILNAILTVAPAIPIEFVSRIIGGVLWVPQFLNILPLALFSFVVCGFRAK